MLAYARFTQQVTVVTNSYMLMFSRCRDSQMCRHVRPIIFDVCVQSPSAHLYRYMQHSHFTFVSIDFNNALHHRLARPVRITSRYPRCCGTAYMQAPASPPSVSRNWKLGNVQPVQPTCRWHALSSGGGHQICISLWAVLQVSGENCPQYICVIRAAGRITSQFR